MVSDMVVSSVTQNIPELNNEPSLFVIVFVQVVIDESVTRYIQLPVLFDIEWIEVCMTSLTFVVRQIKQGMTLHIEHTVPPQNARYTDYVRMETF